MTLTRRKLGGGELDATTLGIGAWAIGGTEWGGSNREEAVAGLRAALDAGVNLIDTAPIYGYGLSEEIVGEAIRGRRSEVILATKCGLVWDEKGGEFFFSNERGDVHRWLGAASLKRQVEASLKRLDVETIDLYQTHFQDGATPIAETMEALLDLRREGKIRAIGVSNVTPAQLRGYVAAGPVASAQEQFSMIDRRHEADLFPLCVELGLGVLAYSPLAMGLLTGKLRPGQSFASGDVRGESRRFAPGIVTAVNAFLESLREIADAHGATLPQLVLAWTMACGAVTHVLTGIRNAQQARENVKAAEIRLSAAEVEDISRRLDAAALSAPPVYG
jgi:aryl-alcohol dehydrogenase-like predicted oxidoreductase